MRKVLLLLVSICISACATLSDQNDLYSAFEECRDRSADADFSKEYEACFSRQLLEAVDLNATDVREQLAFGSLMAKIQNHFQSPDMKCLTVNGFTSAGEPLAFNLRYEEKKIDAINISYVDSEREFSPVATCPSEAE